MFRTQTTTTTDAVGAARYVAAQLGICGLGFGGINQQYLWGTENVHQSAQAFDPTGHDELNGGWLGPAQPEPADFLSEGAKRCPWANQALPLGNIAKETKRYSSGGSNSRF